MTPPQYKPATTSSTVGMERLFNIKPWVFRAPEAIVLLIDVAIEVEIGPH